MRLRNPWGNFEWKVSLPLPPSLPLSLSQNRLETILTAWVAWQGCVFGPRPRKLDARVAQGTQSDAGGAGKRPGRPVFHDAERFPQPLHACQAQPDLCECGLVFPTAISHAPRDSVCLVRHGSDEPWFEQRIPMKVSSPVLYTHTCTRIQSLHWLQFITHAPTGHNVLSHFIRLSVPLQPTFLLLSLLFSSHSPALKRPVSRADRRLPHAASAGPARAC